MTTTQVKKVSKKAEEGEAVLWDGEAPTARLLQEHGWILGAAQGDTQDFTGGPVLRAHVGTNPVNYAIAYPGDYIVKVGDVAYVVSGDSFDEQFDVSGDGDELSNEEEEAELPEYAQHPTGEIPKPPEQMPMGTVEPGPETLDTNWKALEDLAATADGEDEEAAEAAVAQLTVELQNLGVDTDSHPADTWMEMVETTHADVDAAKAEAAGTAEPVEETATEEPVS